jgi:hypothetical protein
LALHVLSS